MVQYPETDVRYEVGAGPYPYRIDGRRMSQGEARSYLAEVENLGALDAQRRLDMAAVEAVHDAPAPRIGQGPDNSSYRIDGGPELSRDQVLDRLVREWRYTPAEAEQALPAAAPGAVPALPSDREQGAGNTRTTPATGNTAPARPAAPGAAPDLPLGRGRLRTDLSWRLFDRDMRAHGLVVGPPGSGGSTALARLADGAHTAGLRTLVVTLDKAHLDPAWEAVAPHVSWCTDADAMVRDLTALLDLDDPARTPDLVLVDGSGALQAAPQLWYRLLRFATRLQVSVVARTYSTGLGEFGDDAVRARLTLHGQYLALGRLRGTTPVLQHTLPGYTPPLFRTRPGRGVYGYGRATAAVTVTA
ncbi:hypothetical protein ABZ234_31780 [Nocardiopsis sp. NPDC006198]|uniref:hypothetical protein n=1 Tax=Nocardiopsis sp. NPDC006198 TaxID=3154472 RepID=UPI0033A72082